MTREEMLALIDATARKYNLPPDKFRAQLMAESNLDVNAVSPRGAIGVGQFMPATAKALGINPRDPGQSIDAAGNYMRQNLNRFGGDYDTALAAYNWGPGNVASKGMTNLPMETRSYIAKVTGGKSGVTGPAPTEPAGPPVPPPDLTQLAQQPSLPTQVNQNYDPRMLGLADILLGMGKKTRDMNTVSFT